MSSITPCIAFARGIEEAVNHYVTLVPDSRITFVQRSPSDNPSVQAGGVLMIGFELEGRPYLALNGGPHFQLTDAFSLSVQCADQAEVDRMTQGLIADGGSQGRCGWVTDRWGLRWQLVPADLPRFLGGPDPEGAQRAMQAMLAMDKLDIATIERAYQGEQE